MTTDLAAPAANSAAMSRRTVPVVVSGAVIGLTWAAILYWGLLATFSMAAAIPHRRSPAARRVVTAAGGTP